MKKEQKPTNIQRYVSKCTAVASIALAMALQPCFALTAQAYVGYDYYGSDYEFDYSNYYTDSSYYYGGYGRNLTSLTKSYDDGTKDTAEYEYNADGNLTYSSVTDSDGSKYRASYTYRDADSPLSSTIYIYDADLKKEINAKTEYSDTGEYDLVKITYEDGSFRSRERWNDNTTGVVKIVTTEVDGVVTQEEYTDDETGQLMSSTSISSDGKSSKSEWRYNEAGICIYYIGYSYDTVLQKQELTENHLEGEGENRISITRTSVTDASGESKTEEWEEYGTGAPIKTVETAPDGTQTEENYTYDANGEETLYIRTENGVTMEKRETRYSRDGYEIIYSDITGYSRTASETSDSKGGSVSETTTRHTDGSSSYRKYVYSDYSVKSYIYRETKPDGTETSSEKIYAEDGSYITTEKTEDGAVIVAQYDNNGNKVSSTKTLADGTQATDIEQRLEDGTLIAEITQYPDGSTDRSDYEYDAGGNVIRITETRRNGVSAVIQLQYSDPDGYTGTTMITFSNGFQTVVTNESIGDVEQATATYSAGDIAQETVTEDAAGNYTIKTVYRDGRTEEQFLSESDYDYDNTDTGYLALDAVNDRYADFLEQAWKMVPAQN